MWTLEGWKTRVQKFNNPDFIDAYQIVMNINMRRYEPGTEDEIIGLMTPEIRTKIIEASESAKTVISKLKPSSPISLREIGLHGKTVNEAMPVIEKFLKNVTGIMYEE